LTLSLRPNFLIMITIICTTNRKPSKSRVVAEFYQSLLDQAGAESRIMDLSDLPANFTSTALYENAGKNESFNQLMGKVEDCEKFVFIVPEYNGSFPGVLKTFIDGLKYPASFKDKKCALVGISSGTQGGALALSHLTDIFNYLGMNVLALKVRMPRIEAILIDGKITDDFSLELLDMQIEQLLKF